MTVKCFLAITEIVNVNPDETQHEEGNIKSYSLLRKQWEGVDWISLAQGIDQWWVLWHAVINRRGP
jgi:hypothetical protein